MPNRTYRCCLPLVLVFLCVPLAPAAEPRLPADTKTIVDPNTAFALDLYRHLARDSAGENLFISPFSISTALAMTYEGARGRTAEEMAAALWPAEGAGGKAARNWPNDRIHAALGTLTRWLNRKGRPYQLAVANALWGERTFPFRQAFVRDLGRHYGAGLFGVDFIGAPEVSRKRINLWVADQTNRRIKDLLPQGVIKPDTRLVLTNAIYFKGDWARQFDEKHTRSQPFTLADGTKVETPLMFQREARFGFFGGSGFQALELPYKGEALSMVVLLPDKPDGLAALEKSLSRANLAAWLGKLRQQDVNVWLPKFKLETEFELKETLAAMGMKRAFVPGQADFTGLSDSPQARRLFISAVRHKAFVEVNEEGTEAAAATAVVIQLESVRIVPQFRADHPFCFLIRDRQTGSILFLGRMMSPAK